MNVCILSPNVAKRQAIPVGAAYVSFCFDASTWVKFGAADVAATIPQLDVTDGTAPEFNPAARQIVAGETHISLISAVAGIAALAFYGKG